jgi:hypothetical protein
MGVIVLHGNGFRLVQTLVQIHVKHMQNFMSIERANQPCSMVHGRWSTVCGVRGGRRAEGRPGTAMPGHAWQRRAEELGHRWQHVEEAAQPWPAAVFGGARPWVAAAH